MAQQEFNNILPGIWLVFGGSYLNHNNAPCQVPDKREQLLVDLLYAYLKNEVMGSQDSPVRIKSLATVLGLLKVWSQDLDQVYQIRDVSGRDHELLLKSMAQKFLQRIKTFENCTIIPSGLISANHSHKIMKSIEGQHENVSLAILKKKNCCIDWVQVNPGSAYHQECPSLTDNKSNSFFEISKINPNEITEEWLYLLAGLKATNPGSNFYYKEVSLYECLLVHLNGTTVFQPHSDQGFITSSSISPVHTWQVVKQSFRYLLRHFLGDNYRIVYQKLLTGFKLFLMEQTFTAFQDFKTEARHFLLQEMCQDVAQLALDQGSEEQKSYTLKLIDQVKAALEQHCGQWELQVRQKSQLGSVHVLSLNFSPPHLTKYTSSSCGPKSSTLNVEPVLVKPSLQDNIIDSLQIFKSTFMDKLISSSKLHEVALLIHGIETLFIDYITKTNILQTSTRSPFSRDDFLLANRLIELAVNYYSCQTRLVNSFLSNSTSQPHFFAKNVIFQFYIYAAIAALNYRDERIGPLLMTHNLGVAVSESLSFFKIIPHLVVQDMAWLQIIFTLKIFFTSANDKNYLFSHRKFQNSKFTFEISNHAETENTDVAFAYQLLQKDSKAYACFIHDHWNLDDEKFNRKWQRLTYSDQYLPPIYCLLSKVAYFAKVSLTGFSSAYGNFDWSFTNTTHNRFLHLSPYYPFTAVYKEYWRSIVHFKINHNEVCTNPGSYWWLSYLLLKASGDKFQRLIIRPENLGKSNSHLLENEIIASQHKTPTTMDRIRYLQLGCLQSEAQLKLERLYIALEKEQVDFNCVQETVLIKQTLFEVSIIMKTNDKFCSLLEWTTNCNPYLIHKLGLLCIKKAQAMQYRLTQHHAIGNILEVILALLTFYPLVYRDEFIKGITEIYHLLKEVLVQPSSNLNDRTLLHLNAYLIISAQGEPQLLETETLTILKALLAIQNFKAKGVELDNAMLLRVHIATFSWSSWVEKNLEQDSSLLNDLILRIIPQWDQGSLWQKGKIGLSYTCQNYTIKPLLGGIYFQNQPIVGLPSTITEHCVFKEYLGQVSFTVIPGTREIDNSTVPCYSSVDKEQHTRLTLIQNALLIEEYIDDDFQLYLPAQELLGSHEYPNLLYKLPLNQEKLRHWLNNSQKILIKNQKRQIIYQWNLKNNHLFSEEHQGYVVPWSQLQAPTFKIWLERIELSSWIEIIALLNSKNSIEIQSLHFPRLGLHFDLKQNQFWSRQVHGFVLAEQQHINTLHGFMNYLVLEKKKLNSTYQVTKIIIPHRQVTPTCSFIAKTVSTDHSLVQCPAYFIYDYDPKTGLLNAHHTHGQLYLALLYYCSASLDDHDLSNCNAYHLARENLEVCWKDQPFDEVELSIIEQFLKAEVMRDFHCNRIALYLKVVSLLSSSLRLAFLYTDEVALQNKKTSDKLLQKCSNYLPFLLSLYIQNKSTVFAGVKLSHEEEREITARVFTLSAYCLLNFEKQSQVVLTTQAKKSYKDHYEKLFSKQALDDTPFLHFLKTYLEYFILKRDIEGINFLSGFNGILLDRFRLIHFMTLYKLAKSSTIPVPKYRYLLHHMVFRAKVNYKRFPAALVMMLARALLLVAENPVLFPESPPWFGESSESIVLYDRHLSKNRMLQVFPAFSWRRPRTESLEEEEKAKKAEEEARREYDLENEQIWSNLQKHDLDSCGVPLRLPITPNGFTLQYECHTTFKDLQKRGIVRNLYLKAAYNDAMYQFFVRVLQLCDQQKYASKMGWSIVPFIDNPITLTFKAKRSASPISEPVSLEKWAFSQQPLITLEDFFTVVPPPALNQDFLYDDKLEKPDNEYQRQFYQELKDSWVAYQNETELSYSWLNAQSLGRLEHVLQTKYVQIRRQADQIWDHIASQLKQRPNSKSDNYFALRWYSGQECHYHKGDVLRLLVEPHKLACYNPDCIPKMDNVIKSVLDYVSCEINATKIVQVLTFIEQCKQVENIAEQSSLLHGLVRRLQENVDPVSFRHPHWFLFQLENEIIVRKNQRELIEAMLNQTEKAMYQLNMGEGKSSVILPLLSNNLANGQQILQINVLPALLTTMKNFLRQRFSGLIRKRVYTFPFHRDTDISLNHLKLILQALETCQRSQHILLVTPEQRLCLQLKVRELMLENQQQIEATNIFNWQTYRQRAPRNIEAYKDLTDAEIDQLLARQDESLQTCLRSEKYIDQNNKILKVPPRGQGRQEFARFKDSIDHRTFREWSCLKAAYRELLYNSTHAYVDSSDKLALLIKISALKVIDLLDESDEILRHGTELNYTIGDKFMFAGGESRWQIPQFFIQTIFCDPELRNVISVGKADGFTVLNEHYSPRGGVPFIQLLNKSYFEESIKPLLIKKFFAENLPIFRKYEMNEDSPLIKGKVSSLRHYIAGQLSLDREKEVMAFLADKGQLKDKILIAKGWLSHGILYHVFNAKYRVRYGLNLCLEGHVTKPIAIPFAGKDTPSPRSEFSHPDVMLGFTIITYLYEGLERQQLKKVIMRLKSKYCDQVANTHLQEWTETSREWIESQTDLFPPIVLTSLKNIDLSDEHCLKKVHEYLSGNHLAILFYLNQFVFLQEAMQYLYKISANAHSLVGYNAALGFSGTDDRKLTMPFQVKSLRSVSQEGTNGKLLSVLTQERNSCYHSVKTEDTNSLLEQLCVYIKEKPHCHALIDAGALVTGLTNHKVALFLLSHLHVKFQGVLYFSDEGNSLTVLTQDRRTIALQDCYLDKQDLFAYLDDIHTRGTDIKLPLNCHAILTVSIGMEKDKLMQAAMRLRQLAQKQSVSLWGTQAVTLAIARDNSIDEAKINSFEVIKWATKNTIEHINKDLFPVAVRKINFQFSKKAEAWMKEAPTTLNSLAQYCQEKEMFSLEEFYGLSPQCQNLADRLYCLAAERIRKFWHEIEEELQSKQLTNTAFYKTVINQAEKCAFRRRLDTIVNEFAIYLGTGYVHTSLDDDEEKEVEVEIIQEQTFLNKVEKREAQIEEPWDPQLILQQDFIGLAQMKNIIMPLAMIKCFIQMPATLENVIWHNDLFMTANFMNSVKCTPAENFDNYLRPVDAILIHRQHRDKTKIVLLSGHEAAQIKAACYQELDNKNLLTHLHDTDGPTQLPTDRSIQISKQEKKLLTIIKLFSGECHYSPCEVKRIAKRVGRLYKHYFTCLNIPVDDACSNKLYGTLIEEGYLDYSGVMTQKLLKLLDQINSGESLTLVPISKFQPHYQHVLRKLSQIYAKLAIKPSSSLKENHITLQKWIGTRGRLKEYIGSALESIFNDEFQLKY